MGHDGQEEVLPAVDAEFFFGALRVVSADRDQNTTTGMTSYAIGIARLS